MPQVTISNRLHDRYLTKTVTVTDEPRPAGTLWLNSHSIWTRRYVRTFYAAGVHEPGSWLPVTGRYDINPHRRKLVSKFTQEHTP